MFVRSADSERWTALETVMRWQADQYDLATDLSHRRHADAADWCQSLQAAAEWAEAVTRAADELHRRHLDMVSRARLGRYAPHVLEFLARRGEVNVAAVVDELGASPTTAGKVLERMAALGVVDEVTGRRRDRVFRYSPFLDLFDRTCPRTGAGVSETGGMSNDARSLADWVPVVAQRLFERSDAKQVILFGSVARGEAGPDSDLDILVVIPVEGRKHDVAVRLLRELRDIPVPIDVVVVDVDEFPVEARLPGIVRVAVREGRVYERAA